MGTAERISLKIQFEHLIAAIAQNCPHLERLEFRWFFNGDLILSDNFRSFATTRLQMLIISPTIETFYSPTNFELISGGIGRNWGFLRKTRKRSTFWGWVVSSSSLLSSVTGLNFLSTFYSSLLYFCCVWSDHGNIVCFVMNYFFFSIQCWLWNDWTLTIFCFSIIL